MLVLCVLIKMTLTRCQVYILVGPVYEIQLQHLAISKSTVFNTNTTFSFGYIFLSIAILIVFLLCFFLCILKLDEMQSYKTTSGYFVVKPQDGPPRYGGTPDGNNFIENEHEIVISGFCKGTVVA